MHKIHMHAHTKPISFHFIYKIRKLNTRLRVYRDPSSFLDSSALSQVLKLAHLFAYIDCSSLPIFTQRQDANIAPVHLLYADM